MDLLCLPNLSNILIPISVTFFAQLTLTILLAVYLFYPRKVKISTLSLHINEFYIPYFCYQNWRLTLDSFSLSACYTIQVRQATHLPSLPPLCNSKATQHQ